MLVRLRVAEVRDNSLFLFCRAVHSRRELENVLAELAPTEDMRVSISAKEQKALGIKVLDAAILREKFFLRIRKF